MRAEIEYAVAVGEPLVLELEALGFPWKTFDPFLFCVHHLDDYPAGNEKLAPAASLAGRQLGHDFSSKDGWNMYHGDVVPGFPRHPHRGFETITIARSGFIDHSDSFGAQARFGAGDVQWMTAGRGIEHAEMFPLLERDAGNPLELFQIWLNLPRADKMVEPHFTMMWNESIAEQTVSDDAGKKTIVRMIAGARAGFSTPRARRAPPSSWAARDHSDVAIWSIAMEPGAQFTISPTHGESNRALYFFRGEHISIGGYTLESHAGVRVRADRAAEIINRGSEPAELLMLQGRPLGEPVFQHGPFVMNSATEIRQAFADYQRTRFGDWPWPGDAPVHDRHCGRFARHADGRVDLPASNTSETRS